MEETRWWTRLLLISAVIALVLLAGGPLGYKFGIVPLQPSLVSLLVALVGAFIVLVAALVMAIVAHRNGLTANRNLILVAIAISLIPPLVMAPQIAKARAVPPIHDITTDVNDPPTYNKAVGLRAHAINDLEYGSEQGSAEKLAEIQLKAYPAVKSLHSNLGTAEALARAEEVLTTQGLQVVNVDRDAGIVEAVATTFWFGFRDDVVVRVRPGPDGSVIDVRSVSRVGVSDVGANAARIMKFLEAF